jgi:hypothetical protein
MGLGGRQLNRERDPLAVDHKVALRARFALIRRIRPGCLAPFWPALTHCRGWLGSNRSGRPRRADPARPGASAPRRRLAANRGVAASRSPRCSSPSLRATSPRGCRSSRRR